MFKQPIDQICPNKMWLLSGGAIMAAALIAVFAVESASLPIERFGAFTACLLAILAASTISSIAGFAFSAICGAFLFHLMPSHLEAVQVMIICSIAIQLLSVAALWRNIQWRKLRCFLLGGLLGVPAGVYLLLNLHTLAYRTVIGTFLILYGAYLLVLNKAAPVRATSHVLDMIAGFLGGITGGLAGFPGAVVTIWCSFKGWDKAVQRGVYQPFILAMQPVTMATIYAMQPSASSLARLDWTDFAYVPAALAGATLGLSIFKRLSDRQFDLAVCVLIVASGIGLLV